MKFTKIVKSNIIEGNYEEDNDLLENNNYNFITGRSMIIENICDQLLPPMPPLFRKYKSNEARTKRFIKYNKDLIKAHKEAIRLYQNDLNNAKSDVVKNAIILNINEHQQNIDLSLQRIEEMNKSLV